MYVFIDGLAGYSGPNKSFKVTAHRGARSKRHFIVLCPLPAMGGTLTQALGANCIDGGSGQELRVRFASSGRVHRVQAFFLGNV